MRVGVDTGGTFTDVVAEDGSVTKVPSNPASPADAVAAGLAGMAGTDVLAHGTTVATNAVLERTGGRVALVTTAGFTDVIEIARQNRPRLYDQFADRPEPLVPRELRFEVVERIAADGSVHIALDRESLPSLPLDVDCVAVCLLHADLNPDHERAVAALVRARGYDVTSSHEVAREFREYERTVTTVLNAYLRRVCRGYLSSLTPVAERVLVMTSAGGLTDVSAAAELPAALLLSGPAGGVWAGAEAARAAGYPNAVTFDMGGTSTDVCLVIDGQPEPAAQREVGGFPVRLPSLDIHTIGAGGGSIATVDAGGALRVGPTSAGAEPGPACYGRGGNQPTVTDADLVAGRIPADAAFPGLGALDATAAQRALDRARIRADDVIAVVDESMVQAVRAVTIERGSDPRQLALVAFGGAGPLHACAIADALEMAVVVVPPRAGVLSAVGLLAGPEQVDLVRTWPDPSSTEGLDDALAELGVEAAARLDAAPGVETMTSIYCRYAGQSHELTVGAVGDFPAEHERRNGYARPATPIEVVALRATARRASPVGQSGLPVPPGRVPAVGPAVLVERDCTVWIPAGWRADVHESGAWVVSRNA
jgi:N-methylhydantoinase A/oxoprolinase/acetone carboxylase beta subunit